MDIHTFIDQFDKNFKHKYVVTPQVYQYFQKCSEDLNPLHTDLQFAESKGFNSCVMYGNILNAFVSHFVGMLLPTPDVMIQCQDINFHKPFFINDELTLKAEIETYSEAVNTIIFKFKFERQNKDKSQTVAKGHVQIGLI